MRPLLGRGCCAALGFLAAGCYTYQPVAGVVPEVGMQVAFDVNDAGRVALGGQMGPEIAQVEGLLVQKDSGSYLVAISTVRLLRGGEQVWTGEQVRLRSEYLGSAYQRRFSMGRSAALGAAALGGFGAFLVSRSILGSGSKDLPGQPTDTANTRLARP
jgi:hypothetical protein